MANFKAVNALKVRFLMTPIRGHTLATLCAIGVVSPCSRFGHAPVEITLRSKMANFKAGGALKLGFSIIPNPRSCSGRVMLNRCWFALFTIRSRYGQNRATVKNRQFLSGGALKVGFVMIPNPRSRYGRVMLNRCCFASVKSSQF